MTAQLPSVELRAVRRFEGWSTATGMTQAVLERVSDVDELEAGPEHVQLVEIERARGLRVDLRVIMACELTTL